MKAQLVALFIFIFVFALVMGIAWLNWGNIPIAIPPANQTTPHMSPFP